MDRRDRRQPVSRGRLATAPVRPRQPADQSLIAAFEDCEVRDTSFLAQDVNAWSSVAYVVVGIGIVVAVSRGRLRGVFSALGVVTALEGVGSFLYHGADEDAAAFIHDVALVGTVGFIAGWHVGRLTARRDAGALIGASSGIAVAAVLTVGPSGTTIIAVVAAVLVTAGADITARRQGMRAVWTRWLLVLVGIAVLAWLAGTPASPFCDEDSWLQPHALWHALTALVIAGWAASANKG